jgi:hypothetical protein
MVVNQYIFHVALENGHCENVKIIYCNFCDEYKLDPVLYKEIFNTVLSPQTGVLQTFFNPTLAAIPIKWPPVIMDIGQFADIEFHFGDGYIYMGSEMSWVPFPLPNKLLAKKPQPQPIIKKNKEY